MANGHGGYRRPENPAPVSGPGKFSQRTDGGPGDARQPIRYVPGMEYGGGQELMDIQSGAPMAAEGSAPRISFDAPTERPDEPITHGAPIGAGAGPEALPVGAPDDDKVAAVIRAAYANYPSPQLSALVAQLDAEGR